MKISRSGTGSEKSESNRPVFLVQTDDGFALYSSERAMLGYIEAIDVENGEYPQVFACDGVRYRLDVANRPLGGAWIRRVSRQFWSARPEQDVVLVRSDPPEDGTGEAVGLIERVLDLGSTGQSLRDLMQLGAKRGRMDR